MVVVGAVVLGWWTERTSDVPNDPNIGGGILLLAGIVMIVTGLLRLSGRRS